jgi:hypothetical protein
MIFFLPDIILGSPLIHDSRVILKGTFGQKLVVLQQHLPCLVNFWCLLRGTVEV